MTYYKWLTPDMTSHRDRRYRWRLDRSNRVPVNHGADAEAKGNGLYLMKRPVDALRFGRWPGCLFEAEPAGRIIAEDEGKVRCSAVRLLRELEPAQVFGPNGKRVVEFLSWLKDIPWLEAESPLEAAIEAAAEHQARLSQWGWPLVPIETARFDDWKEAAAFAQDAVSPAIETGAWTAWATTGSSWPLWTTPWAASGAWGAVWASLEASAGASAWSMYKQDWNGPVPWPAPTDEAWREAANAVRAATRIVAGAAANDAARTAEYVVCSDRLPPNPFEPLMLVWMLGYWPVGVIGGRYVIADLSAIVGMDKPTDQQRRDPQLAFRQYVRWSG